MFTPSVIQNIGNFPFFLISIYVFVVFRVELQKRLPWLAIKETLPSETQSTTSSATAVVEATSAPA